jgi:hypothetical protein
MTRSCRPSRTARTPRRSKRCSRASTARTTPDPPRARETPVADRKMRRNRACESRPHRPVARRYFCLTLAEISTTMPVPAGRSSVGGRQEAEALDGGCSCFCSLVTGIRVVPAASGQFAGRRRERYPWNPRNAPPGSTLSAAGRGEGLRRLLLEEVGGSDRRFRQVSRWSTSSFRQPILRGDRDEKML